MTRRHHPEDVIGIASAEHGVDPRFGRRHQWQAVAPSQIGRQALHGFEGIIGNVDSALHALSLPVIDAKAQIVVDSVHDR